jgi:hypothetical protein
LIKRNQLTEDVATTVEYCTATISGTYVAGGFTFNPLTITDGIGSSPVSGSKVLDVSWRPTLGHVYYTSVAGNVATTKIYGAANTELTAGPVPDAVLTFTITKTKI